MKLSTAVAVSILSSTVYSQTIQIEVGQLPSCALTCLSTAITGADCSLTDFACQCGDMRSTITRVATPCIVSGCSTADALNTQKIVQEICVLQAAGGGSSSSSGAAASPATTSATGAAAATTSAGSSIGSSIEPVTTTASTPSTTTQAAASSSSSAPATVSQAAASRLEAVGVVAGAGILVAFVL